MNPLRAHMPLMLAHAGEWDGVYRHVAADGALLDEHRARTSCIFPDEGDDHYIQHSRLSWPDGRREEYLFAGSFSDGLLRWATDRFHGYGWETHGAVMLRLDRLDVPGAYYLETIALGDDGRSRSRVWQWFKDGRPWKRTLCDEVRVE